MNVLKSRYSQVIPSLEVALMGRSSLPADTPALLTVRELLRIGLRQAYELVNDDGFPSIRVGRTIRIPRTALEAWMTDRCETGECDGQ